jgi:D-amino-acid dehydrogenase
MEFLYQCLPFNWKRNIKDIVNLATYSRDELGRLVDEEKIEYDRLRAGIIHFYDNESEFNGAKKATEVLAEYGCVRHPCTRAELVEAEKALAHYQNIIGGTITLDDESGDAEKFTKALAKICQSKYGVRFEFNTTVEDIDRTQAGALFVASRADGESAKMRFPDNVVVCAGTWSPALAKKWGERLSIFPAKGYSLTVNIKDPARVPTVSLTDDAFKMVFSRLGDRLRVAGTAEFGADHEGINYDDFETRCKPLQNRTIELFGRDTFDWNTAKYWSGLRPATPSNVPYIGPSRKMKQVYFNTGHGTLGWTMSCGSGKAIASIINGETPPVDFSWYR